MGFGGSTSAMIVTIRNNARLLKKNDIYSHLKRLDNARNPYTGTSVSPKELKEIRKATRLRIKNERRIRIVVGILVILPLIIFIFGMFYLIIERAFL